MKWKVGDKAFARFTRVDGTLYCRRGVITRIWGKIPYAVTFFDGDEWERHLGPEIRIGIDELHKTLPAECSPGRSRNAGRRKPGSSSDRVHETKAGKISDSRRKNS